MLSHHLNFLSKPSRRKNIQTPYGCHHGYASDSPVRRDITLPCLLSQLSSLGAEFAERSVDSASWGAATWNQYSCSQLGWSKVLCKVLVRLELIHQQLKHSGPREVSISYHKMQKKTQGGKIMFKQVKQKKLRSSLRKLHEPVLTVEHRRKLQWLWWM